MLLFRTQCQQRIDRGSMQMVEHQVIYSLERKKQWSHNEYYKWLLFKSYVKQWQYLLSLLAADPPSSSPKWISLCLFSWFPLISSRFQLTLFTRTGRARPYFPTFLQIGSGKLWIQATAHFPVRHSYEETNSSGASDHWLHNIRGPLSSNLSNSYKHSATFCENKIASIWCFSQGLSNNTTFCQL
jgi:hypothetical protein